MKKIINSPLQLILYLIVQLFLFFAIVINDDIIPTAVGVLVALSMVITSGWLVVLLLKSLFESKEKAKTSELYDSKPSMKLPLGLITVLFAVIVVSLVTHRGDIARHAAKTASSGQENLLNQ